MKSEEANETVNGRESDRNRISTNTPRSFYESTKNPKHHRNANIFFKLFQKVERIPPLPSFKPSPPTAQAGQLGLLDSLSLIKIPLGDHHLHHLFTVGTSISAPSELSHFSNQACPHPPRSWLFPNNVEIPVKYPKRGIEYLYLIVVKDRTGTIMPSVIVFWFFFPVKRYSTDTHFPCAQSSPAFERSNYRTQNPKNTLGELQHWF